MLKHYPDSIFEEIKLLSKFPDESQLEGIKIHHDADDSIQQAAQSLCRKGFITQMDGGYLTSSGQELLINLHQILDTLK